MCHDDVRVKVKSTDIIGIGFCLGLGAYIGVGYGKAVKNAILKIAEMVKIEVKSDYDNHK